MDTTTKTAKSVRMDAAKSASKKLFQKAAVAAGDLSGNKTSDKTTFVGKWRKNTMRPQLNNDTQEIYISLEKRQQIIADLSLISFSICKNGISNDYKPVRQHILISAKI